MKERILIGLYVFLRTEFSYFLEQTFGIATCSIH